MWKLGSVGMALIAASCMTEFPELVDSDAASSGGQSQGGFAGSSFGGSSASGGSATGGSGGSGGNGGSVGGSAGDASTGGAGSGGTAGDSGPDAPLIPGLLGHWPFDDASGNVAVDVIGGNDATLPASDATWTAGVFGGAIALGAPTTGISAPGWDNAAFPTTGTLTLWLKAVIVPNDTSSRGIFDNHDTARDHVFVRRANGSPTIALQCAFQAKAAQYAFVKTVPIASDTWQLVAVGWSPTEGFCYIHGNLQSGLVTGAWSPSTQRFRIGANATATFDDVRLYDHMLTVTELAKLLAQGP
jgi:hypothetical protein